jgi:hypothetical protein
VGPTPATAARVGGRMTRRPGRMVGSVAVADAIGRLAGRRPLTSGPGALPGLAGPVTAVGRRWGLGERGCGSTEHGRHYERRSNKAAADRDRHL